jgi:hypothetical protein
MRWRRRTIYTWPIDFVTNLLEFDELAYLLQRIWLNSMCSQVQNEFWRSLCAGNLLWTLALTRSINLGLYGTKIRSAQHRGIVRTIRCCLASVSATMKRGGRSRAKPWSISKSLVVFRCQVYTPIPQASRVSLNSKDCATQSVECTENRSLMWITSRLAWSSKNDSRLHQRNKPIYRVVKAGLILNRKSRTRYRSVTTSKTKAIRKAGIWLTCYWEKSWPRNASDIINGKQLIYISSSNKPADLLLRSERVLRGFHTLPL